MALPHHQTGPFTYADYLTWPDDGRWELIRGVAYDMSAAPGRAHQRVLLRMARVLAERAEATGCEVYVAPFDVRLATADGRAGRPLRIAADEESGDASEAADADRRGAGSDEAPPDRVDTVVQPDLSLFCDPAVLDDRGAHGPPDLAVEIISPSTGYKDQTQKLALYQETGVTEYWIVNPDARYIMVYRRRSNGTYGKPDYYHGDDGVTGTVLGEPAIPLVTLLG
ncbi:MAG: Uma2 family endonuclease [Spirochaetales bacterium]|nr:Uma2 family endonuclease [Spirochaetales bacterium]